MDKDGAIYSIYLLERKMTQYAQWRLSAKREDSKEDVRPEVIKSPVRTRYVLGLAVAVSVYVFADEFVKSFLDLLFLIF